MTDVRLTATNPVDSSVVPVAANSRGELLVESPTISEINNDVTIAGQLYVSSGVPGSPDNVFWKFSTTSRLTLTHPDSDGDVHDFTSSGMATHRRMGSSPKGRVTLSADANPFLIANSAGQTVYSIDWSGNATTRSVFIALEPDDPAHYALVRSVDDESEQLAYQGPKLDVLEELQFLRTQLRQTMERLKMTPEGGWEVWDGSAESP